MKTRWKLLMVCIVIPLLAGVLSAALTGEGMELFEQINKPALSPPGWIFPIVWTILYTLMGISSYLILTSGADQEEIKRANSVYVYQLLVNFLWPTLFFDFQWFLFSFLWLLLLILLVGIMIRRFYKISKPAAYLNIPYFLWLCFAAYLNLTIWRLNM